MYEPAGVPRDFDRLYLELKRIATEINGILLRGTGSPENVVAAAVGSLYVDEAGAAGTTLYVKETGGNGNTGWAAK